MASTLIGEMEESFICLINVNWISFWVEMKERGEVVLVGFL